MLTSQALGGPRRQEHGLDVSQPQASVSRYSFEWQITAPAASRPAGRLLSQRRLWEVRSMFAGKGRSGGVRLGSRLGVSGRSSSCGPCNAVAAVFSALQLRGGKERLQVLTRQQSDVAICRSCTDARSAIAGSAVLGALRTAALEDSSWATPITLLGLETTTESFATAQSAFSWQQEDAAVERHPR